MNNSFQTWSIRFLLGGTAFFAAVALAQTLVIVLVLAIGQDIQLHRWSINQQNYYELYQDGDESARFEYHYTIDGEEYSGEVVVKALKTDDPRLSYWAMPAGHVNGIYQLKVWDKLPMFALPSLPDHHPFNNAFTFWIASLTTLLGYRAMRRPELKQSL